MLAPMAPALTTKIAGPRSDGVRAIAVSRPARSGWAVEQSVLKRAVAVPGSHDPKRDRVEPDPPKLSGRQTLSLSKAVSTFRTGAPSAFSEIIQVASFPPAPSIATGSCAVGPGLIMLPCSRRLSQAPVANTPYRRQKWMVESVSEHPGGVVYAHADRLLGSLFDMVDNDALGNLDMLRGHTGKLFVTENLQYWKGACCRISIREIGRSYRCAVNVHQLDRSIAVVDHRIDDCHPIPAGRSNAVVTSEHGGITDHQACVVGSARQ